MHDPASDSQTTRQRESSAVFVLQEDSVNAVVDNEQLRKGTPSLTEIRDELDFAQWYAEAEGVLRETSYDEYQSCLDELQVCASHLEALLSDTTTTLNLLTTLSEQFRVVESQTSQFRSQCQGLLSSQQRNTELAENIRENLQYYDFLDPASRRLNGPGAGNSVREKEFSDMLRRLDECLDYMESHPQQRDSEVYRSRYRLLMTRALTLVRGHFVSTLRDMYANVSKKISERPLNDTSMSALLYAKFRVGAPEMKQIGLEIQKRAVPPADPDQGTEAEYQSLVDELHSNFASIRGKLIIPLVRKKLNEIALAPSTSKDLVAFARASITYIRGICLDEFDLWGEWFHGQGGLYDFLETICEPFYDYLRPKIIYETSIVKLCQLCTLLQARYSQDAEDGLENHNVIQLDFPSLIQPALEDVQTRLVFRAQTFLRDEIERYKARPADLDYPARNRHASLSATSGQIKDRTVATSDIETGPSTSDEVNAEIEPDTKWDFNAQSTLSHWYPTLGKAIWLLSRIYRLVNSTVFDDLAHQIVHQTTLSLLSASSVITGKASPADGQLFLMSHLLVLKQQIVAFDIEYVAPEVSFDFSGIMSTFWELRERGGLFNARNLMRLVGHGLLPRVVENMLDAKVELDGRLRTVINDFIDGFATKMTASLPSRYVNQANLNNGERQVIAPTCQNIEKVIVDLRKILDDYLDDTRMKETLVGAVRDRVIQIYEDFLETYISSERGKGNVVSRKGKGRDDGIWDVDTFAEWCEGTFRVRESRPRSASDDADDDYRPRGRGTASSNGNV